jgi:hypothetical protein
MRLFKSPVDFFRLNQTRFAGLLRFGQLVYFASSASSCFVMQLIGAELIQWCFNLLAGNFVDHHVLQFDLPGTTHYPAVLNKHQLAAKLIIAL